MSGSTTCAWCLVQQALPASGGFSGKLHEACLPFRSNAFRRYSLLTAWSVVFVPVCAPAVNTLRNLESFFVYKKMQKDTYMRAIRTRYYDSTLFSIAHSAPFDKLYLLGMLKRAGLPMGALLNLCLGRGHRHTPDPVTAEEAFFSWEQSIPGNSTGPLSQCLVIAAVTCDLRIKIYALVKAMDTPPTPLPQKRRFLVEAIDSGQQHGNIITMPCNRCSNV